MSLRRSAALRAPWRPALASCLTHGALLGCGWLLFGDLVWLRGEARAAPELQWRPQTATLQVRHEPPTAPRVEAPNTARPQLFEIPVEFEGEPIELPPLESPTYEGLTRAMLRVPPPPPNAAPRAEPPAEVPARPQPLTSQPAIELVDPDRVENRDAAAVYRAPRLRPETNPNPRYPRAAARRRLEGVARVWVRVDAEGGAQEVRLHESSGHSLLDEAALQAVRTWRFHPATRGEQTTEGQLIVPLRFRAPR